MCRTLVNSDVQVMMVVMVLICGSSCKLILTINCTQMETPRVGVEIDSPNGDTTKLYYR